MWRRVHATYRPVTESRDLVSVSRRVLRSVFWSLGLEGLTSRLGLEGFRSRSRPLRLETLHGLFFMTFCVMALGHYMREKSTESKGDSPAESTQTAETIESGSAGTAGKTRKGGQKQGKKPKGESRNK